MVRNVLVGNVEMFDRLLTQLEAFLFSLRAHLWRNDESLVRTSETALCFHDMLQIDFQGRQPLDPLRVHRVRHDAVASRLKRIDPRWLLGNARNLAELRGGAVILLPVHGCPAGVKIGAVSFQLCLERWKFGFLDEIAIHLHKVPVRLYFNRISLESESIFTKLWLE